MKKTFSFIYKFVKTVIAMLIAAFILSVFVLGYNYTGVHVINESGATDFKWQEKQLITSMSEGFAWFYMDENGFNNAYPVKSGGVDILLMGSSHMEAAQVLPDKNTGYLLNEYLPELYTYNIGVSAHSIYSCMQNLSDALSMYEPEKYVIIEADTMNLSIEMMQLVLQQNLNEIPSYDFGIMYFLQKNIPASKNIYKQLDAWIHADISLQEDDGNVADIDYMLYVVTLNKFLGEASELASDRGIKLVIFYHPPVDIDAYGNMVAKTDEIYLEIFEDVCKRNNIVFVDMTQDFYELYQKDHVLAYGFNNTIPGIGHLNSYGHDIIARRLASVLMEEEETADVSQ